MLKKKKKIGKQVNRSTFLCINVKPTVEPLKLCRIQCSNRIGHAGGFAYSPGVDSSDSEVIGVSFK